VELTEPEINAIHAAVAFVGSACKEAGFSNYWLHYGSTLEGLSERLAEAREIKELHRAPAKSAIAAASAMNRYAAKALVGSLPLPPLGDSSNHYPVELTEPEINAIHATVAFVGSACKEAGFTKYWEHYGPTLEALSERLAAFDD
jgi:hypothetical protein